jgi:hypothetical protein
VIGTIPGTHQVFFEVSGPNAAAFVTPLTAVATVAKRTFSVSAIPTLVAGVASPQITSTYTHTLSLILTPHISFSYCLLLHFFAHLFSFLNEQLFI